MKKKLFALASVSVVSVFAAGVFQVGCSSDSTSGAAQATDAGRRDATIIGDDDAATATCLTPDAIDATQYAYSDPHAPLVGACTTDDLTTLSDYFEANAGVAGFSVADWIATVGDACGKCAFGDVNADNNWAPILYDPDTDKLADINRGACIGTAAAKTTCGKAYQQWSDCTFDACGACTTDAEFADCIGDQNLQDKICKGAIDAVKSECGSKLSSYEQSCKSTKWIFEGPIRVACIYGGTTKPKDAGADADAGDAGDAGDAEAGL